MSLKLKRLRWGVSPESGSVTPQSWSTATLALFLAILASRQFYEISYSDKAQPKFPLGISQNYVPFPLSLRKAGNYSASVILGWHLLHLLVQGSLNVSISCQTKQNEKTQKRRLLLIA